MAMEVAGQRAEEACCAGTGRLFYLCVGVGDCPYLHAEVNLKSKYPLPPVGGLEEGVRDLGEHLRRRGGVPLGPGERDGVLVGKAAMYEEVGRAMRDPLPGPRTPWDEVFVLLSGHALEGGKFLTWVLVVAVVVDGSGSVCVDVFIEVFHDCVSSTMSHDVVCCVSGMMV